MQFIYVKECGSSSLTLDVKEYAHIFKVRRVKLGSNLFLRNLVDDFVYEYKIEDISKKVATLTLIEKKELQKKPQKELHVGWCVVDVKTVEKTLAMLNEMGVTKISFVYADYSQTHFKLDSARLQRILINSCEQCGRSDLMEFETIQSVKEFLELYTESIVIDFSEKSFEENLTCKTFLVGPEGGFSDKERKLFSDRDIYGLKAGVILRSETAVVGVCAKLSL